MLPKVNLFPFQAGFFSLIILTSPLVHAADAPDAAPATIASITASLPTYPPPVQNPAADGRILTIGVTKDVAPRGNNLTDHKSNYDERIADVFTLPDVLVLANGQPVKDADTWWKLRRPEILKNYQTEIYGRIPDTAPKVTWKVASTDPKALGGMAVMKTVVGHIGDPTDPRSYDITLTMYTPANAKGPVPFFLQLTFGNNIDAPGTPFGDILSRGYGYGSIAYQSIELDSANRSDPGPIEFAMKPGQTTVAPDEWGCISSWAWGLSRIEDYLETDKDVDAKRVAIIGHSRLGKTVLWAGAQDQRFAMVLSSQSGEMGAALARHDYGETVDDSVAASGFQYAGNLKKFAGKWNDMPVDAHMLIALIAPRPVLITAANGDTWSDPHGQLLSLVFADPVYKMLGEKGLNLDKSQSSANPNTTPMPPIDSPILNGKLGYIYHNGPHQILPVDWKAFLAFADLYLKPAPAVQK